MKKLLALIWALVVGKRAGDVVDVVADEERCTAWSVRTVDLEGRIGGAGERCPERAVASGGEAGGGLPPVWWAFCERHYEEHLERERNSYDAFDYLDYFDYADDEAAR